MAMNVIVLIGLVVLAIWLLSEWLGGGDKYKEVTVREHTRRIREK